MKMMIVLVLVKMLLFLVLITAGGAVISGGGYHDLQATEAVTDLELNPVKAGVEYNVYFYRRSGIRDKVGGIGVDPQACPPPIVEFENEYSGGASDLELSVTMSLHPVTPTSDGIVRRDTPVYIKLAKDIEFDLPSACPSSYRSTIWKVQEYDQNNTGNIMIVTTGGQMGDLETSGVFVFQSVFLSPRANKISALLVGNNKPYPIVPFQPQSSSSSIGGDESYFYLRLGDEKATDPFFTGGPFKVAFLKKPTAISSIIHPIDH